MKKIYNKPLKNDEQSNLILLKELATELGDFSQPQDFDFGEEFEQNIPRTIHPQIKKGPFEIRWRRSTINIFVLGLFCLLFSGHSKVIELSYYILPLGYLNYIAYGIFILLVLGNIRHYFIDSTYSYIRYGMPIVGRILRVDKYLKGSGGYSQFGFAADVEYVNPENGCHEFAQVKSRALSSPDNEKNYSVTISPGNYVTLVAKPGRIVNTLKLYGFLGLNSAVDYIRYKGRAMYGLTLLAATAISIGVLAMIVIALMGLYSMEFYVSIGENENEYLLLYAPAVGAVIAVVIWVVQSYCIKNKPDLKTRFIFSFGGLFLGMLGAFSATQFLNASLDHSESTYRDFEVVEYWQKTANMVFRNYEIEIKMFSTPTHLKCTSPVEAMSKFYDTNAGVAEIGEGAFGNKWIRALHPAVLMPLEEGDSLLDLVVRAPVESEDGIKGTVALKAVIDLGDGKTMKVSEKITDHIRKHLKSASD